MESFNSQENINVAENLKEKLKEISNLYDELKKIKNDRTTEELDLNEKFRHPDARKKMIENNDKDLIKYDELLLKSENRLIEITRLETELKKIRFETGIQYLQIVNEKKPEWKKIQSKTFGAFRTEKWKSVFDSIETYLEFSIESLPLFGSKNNEKKIDASFMVVPNTFFKKNQLLWPGLEVTQESYSNDVYVAGNLFYDVSESKLKISEEQKNIAAKEMLELIESLELIEDIESKKS